MKYDAWYEILIPLGGGVLSFFLTVLFHWIYKQSLVGKPIPKDVNLVSDGLLHIAPMVSWIIVMIVTLCVVSGADESVGAVVLSVLTCAFGMLLGCNVIKLPKPAKEPEMKKVTSISNTPGYIFSGITYSETELEERKKRDEEEMKRQQEITMHILLTQQMMNSTTNNM